MATASPPEEANPDAAGPGPKKHDDLQTAGLEKVTDYVEEKEISAGELGRVMRHHD